MDLEVVGRHALLFDDDANSALVNSTDVLVPYGGNPSLLIDRYDVRHLLQRIPPYSRKNQKLGKREEHEGDGVPRSEIDHQRYLDLPPEEEGREEGLGTAFSGSESKKVTEMIGSGGYQAVPFSYANVDDFSVQKDADIDLKQSGYHPPFSLPQALLSNLPPTEKLHQIIAKTAVFVSKHGGQSEIILRVKQGDNPTFGFLMPDHQLHAYFRYLVDHPELVDGVRNVSDGKDEKSMVEGQVKRSHVALGGALSLLGSVYGSGDEDAETGQGTNFKEIEMVSSVNDATTMTSSKDGNMTSSIHKSMEDRTNMRPLAVAKEKSVPLRKNQPIVSLHSDTTGSKAKGVTSSSDVSRSQLHSKLSASEKILEPSSTLKRMVDKIVEFIVKNGKEFEAILIEQDKPHGRFPFLLPSSVYHSYYLKILREAQEIKILGKNVRDLDHDLSERIQNSRKGRKTKGSATYLEDTSSQDGTYDLERKEKFKMVIGGSKKDPSELPSKTAKQPGVSADDAAAIVMAATRGLSSSMKHDDSAKKSAITADAVAAIVLQTTTGSSSPPVSDALANGGRSSSSGNLSALPLGQVSIRKQGSDSKLSSPLPADLPGSGIQLCGEEGSDKTSNMILANVIAKTAAFAAASEADSSDASLTREQKLKAERLKKAKMFAAMIKNSGDGGGKPKWCPPAGTGLSGSQPVASGSVLSGPVSDGNARETEGSSVPVSANAADMESARPRGEHKSRKHRSSRHYDEEPVEDEESMKKKRRHSEQHSSRHRRKRHHHSSSKNKHSGSDEEERQHRSRRHHECHRSSSDDEHLHHGSSSYRHERKKSRHGSRRRESEEENGLLRQESEREGSREAPTRPPQHTTTVGASTPDAQASNGTEVPDDLRAKVRAMLLATM